MSLAAFLVEFASHRIGDLNNCIVRLKAFLVRITIGNVVTPTPTEYTYVIAEHSDDPDPGSFVLVDSPCSSFMDSFVDNLGSTENFAAFLNTSEVEEGTGEEENVKNPAIHLFEDYDLSVKYEIIAGDGPRYTCTRFEDAPINTFEAEAVQRPLGSIDTEGGTTVFDDGIRDIHVQCKNNEEYAGIWTAKFQEAFQYLLISIVMLEDPQFPKCLVTPEYLQQLYRMKAAWEDLLIIFKKNFEKDIGKALVTLKLLRIMTPHPHDYLNGKIYAYRLELQSTRIDWGSNKRMEDFVNLLLSDDTYFSQYSYRMIRLINTIDRSLRDPATSTVRRSIREFLDKKVRVNELL